LKYFCGETFDSRGIIVWALGSSDSHFTEIDQFTEIYRFFNQFFFKKVISLMLKKSQEIE
jgi:hypothetical protein